MKLWIAVSDHAAIAGEDFGPVGPVAEQASLGDFALPQRGMFMVGRSFFY